MTRTRVSARSKITSKGQITLPKAVREHFNLQPGDEIEFIETEKGMRVRKYFAVSPFDEWRGYLTELAGRDPDELVDEMRGR